MRGSWRYLVAVGLTISPAAIAQTRNQPANWGSPRIDPRADMLFAHRLRFAETIPVYRRTDRFEHEGAMPVIVRFSQTPSQATMSALRLQGVAWHFSGRPLVSGAYSAHVDQAALHALERESGVARVEVDLPMAAPAPLEMAARETMVESARRAIRRRDGVELDGTGVVIGDVDSSVFIFHPALFRADAGVYPWIDVDQNGVFNNGTDAVDLDRDGVAGPAELLSTLFAHTYSRYGGPPPEPASNTFRADRDWLYVDENSNRSRDYGQGFEETTPAYGEPIFVADDANRNNRLDPEERLLRLGTSKIRAVLGMSEYFRGGDTGLPLIQYNLGNDMAAFQAQGHATGVAGILSAGVPGVSRWLGLAPGADLLEGDNRQFGGRMGTTGALQWEIDHGANVLLTEYAPYASTTLDGSSEEELLLDSALDMNVIPVSPAGNLATGHKHRRLDVTSSGTAIPMQTLGGFDGATLIQMTIHHRLVGRTLAATVTFPGGTSFPLPESTTGAALANGVTVYHYTRTTMRGTVERHILLYRRAVHASGAYVLRLTASAGGAVPIDIYVGDDRTSWSGGFSLDGNDESRTICHPSTSDRTLSVAAYVLHSGMAYGGFGPEGVRAGYSSQGPRLDGDPGLDIAAPDNPLSLTPPLPGTIGYGGYQAFGGTSGAGPHVAAAAALLRQQFPTETGEEIRARITDNARHDANATADALTLYGHGKLDVAAAFGLPPTMSQPPTITLRAPAQAMLGGSALVTPIVADDGDRSVLRVRWDLDYDGTPDTDWIEAEPRVIPTPALGFIGVRIEVRDSDGYVAGAAARIEVVRELPIIDAGDTTDATAGDGGGAMTRPGCGCRTPGESRRSSGIALMSGAVAIIAASARRRRCVRR